MLSSELSRLLAAHRDNDIAVEFGDVRCSVAGLRYCTRSDQLVIAIDQDDLAIAAAITAADLTDTEPPAAADAIAYSSQLIDHLDGLPVWPGVGGARG